MRWDNSHRCTCPTAGIVAPPTGTVTELELAVVTTVSRCWRWLVKVRINVTDRTTKTGIQNEPTRLLERKLFLIPSTEINKHGCAVVGSIIAPHHAREDIGAVVAFPEMSDQARPFHDTEQTTRD